MSTFLKNIFISKTHDIGGIWWNLVGSGGIWWDLVGSGGIWWDLVGSGGGIKRFHQIPEAGGICGGII
jgi:hypothetical protein